MNALALESNSVVAGLPWEAVRQALGQVTHGSADVAPREQRSLRRNLAWTMAGDGIYAACQWGMLIVIAKLGSAEMVGQFALGLAITAPVFLLTSLALRPIQATDVKDEYVFRDYLGLRLLTTVFALAIIGGLVFATDYRRETALVILAVGLAKAMEAVSDVFYGLLQQHERMDCISKSQIFKGPLSLCAMAFGLYATGGVLWGVVGLAVTWALLLLGYDVRNGAMLLRTSRSRVSMQPRWDLDVMGRLIWLALPLGFATMFISISASIPRYYIEHYWGERELGIFAAMAYLMVAGGMLINAAGQVVAPRLAQYYAQRNAAAFRGVLLKLIALAALVAVGGVGMAWGAGREILAFLYRPEYAGYVDVFIWVMVAAGITYFGSCLGYGITATRAFGSLFFPYFAIALVTLIASALLIPLKGLTGAAWTLCITGVATCVAPIAIFHRLKKRGL